MLGPDDTTAGVDVSIPPADEPPERQIPTIRLGPPSPGAPPPSGIDKADREIPKTIRIKRKPRVTDDGVADLVRLDDDVSGPSADKKNDTARIDLGIPGPIRLRRPEGPTPPMPTLDDDDKPKTIKIKRKPRVRDGGVARPDPPAESDA